MDGGNQLAAVAEHVHRRIGLIELDGNPALLRCAPDTLDRLGHDQVDLDRLRGGASSLSMRQRSSRSSMIRLTRKASEWIRVARRMETVAVGLDGEGLGEQAEGTDRGLQLVAHVGDEVARISSRRRRSETSSMMAITPSGRRPSSMQPGAHREGPAGRPVEVEGALGGALLPGVLEELGHRLGGEGVAVAAGHQPDRPCVPEGDLAVSSQTMTPWGSVSRARLSRMASALASVTASAASPVTCSRWLRTGSTPCSSGGVTPRRLESAVRRCWRLRWPDLRPYPGGYEHGDNTHRSEHDVTDHVRLHCLT